jgi:ketosteroid isomerase-like protein
VSNASERTPTELVQWAFGDIAIGSETDMKTVFDDATASARLAEIVAPEAPIEFTTPEGGLMGEMAGPWHGFDGLRAAWLEWTAPWASWTFRSTDLIDAGEGRVLLLGDSVGRLEGSGTDVVTHAAAIHYVSDGRIVRVRHFLDQDQARQAAGLA